MYLNIYQLLQWLPVMKISLWTRCKTDPRYSGLFSYSFCCTHFWIENAGPIESSWCTQVELEPGYGARLAMFSARFNEKNKEACIAVVTEIQAPKFFHTQKQRGTRTFKNLPVELCFQRESAVGSWEDTENKFRAVHKLLLENHYDVMMVEAGAEKICTAHFDPCCQTHAQDWMLTSIESSILVCVLYICTFVISLRCLYMFIPCFPEILFLISCQLASIEAYKKMLNRNLIVWKDWNPVSWTSKARCPFWIQPSIERFEVFPSRRNNMPQSACSSHVSYWYRIGICWNVDAIPGNDGTLALGWSRKLPTVFVSGSCVMKMVLNQNGRTLAVSCRRRREFWQNDGWIFAPAPKWEGHNAGCVHKWLRWDDGLTLFFICRTRICPRVQVRCAAVAGRGPMETQSCMRGRSPRHQKACAGVYFDGFQTQPCQGWLSQLVNKRNCLQDSSCLAQGDACIDPAGRGMRAETC